MRIATRDQAFTQFHQDRPLFERRGIILSGARAFLSDDIRFAEAPDKMAMDSMMAMDSQFQPGLTTDPNSAVPALLTTYIDPAVYEILFAPNKAAEIFGENRKGTWLDETAMFPVVEHTGEVSSYGDRSESGRAGVNTNWPQRQAYLWQTIMEYGERELERAGLARVNWVSEVNRAAATVMGKFTNLTYFFGVRQFANYGLLNDPNLPAALTPSAKANGGVTWFTAGGGPNAQANEVYNDILALFEALVVANAGLLDRNSKLTLAMSPGSEVALGFANTFNVFVSDLLKKGFPNLTVKNAVQYGALSASNPQGSAGGNLLQLIADDIEGQDTGYCSFNEKMRSHPIIRQLSSFRQKVTGGSWGAIIRMPVAFAQMIGI